MGAHERLVVFRGHGFDEGTQLGLEAREDPPHLARLHAGLEIVEKSVVRFDRVETGDVLVLELERPIEHGSERGEVGALARDDPCLDRGRGVARQLGLELGRNPARLGPVGARHCDQASVVALRIERRLQRAYGFQQLADRVVGEHLVGDTLHRRHVVGSAVAAGRGHHHELIPLEKAPRHPEVADVLEA